MGRRLIDGVERCLESTESWYATMPRPTAKDHLVGATFRCFRETSPTMMQPALDKNVICIHLGGPKRVSRWQGRMHETWDVPLHAITLMPAFRANRWHTEGVVAYAHLALGADLLSRLAREEFDREPSELLVLDKVGVVDPLLAELMLALSREVIASGFRRVYRDTLLTTLGITVLKRHATLLQGSDSNGPRCGRITGGLAAWQLRRVIEYMAANALRDVGLDELVQITRLSRAQFFRSFRRSTGHTPARYLQQIRMRHAADLLVEGRTVADVSEMIGYGNTSHFAAVFRRCNGVTPSEWRRVRRP